MRNDEGFKTPKAAPIEWDENGLCVLCHKERTPEGHDPCIANLPGVIFACCGHGVGDAYIKFEDGRCLNFKPLSVDLDLPTHEYVQRVPVYTDSRQAFDFKKKKEITEPLEFQIVETTTISYEPIRKKNR